ncbi:MAG: L,D-transpeptidase family protein [Prolixibacteraceae bacterium]|nr:L,D-transpeptidase family protein [Prolixibacteraceae bacterium]
MKKNRAKRIILFSFIIVFLAVSIYSLYKYLSNTPPKAEVKNAVNALAQAKKEQADKYAEQIFSEADKMYNQAMSEWKYQNERFLLIRDYEKVKELAGKSFELSNKAFAKAVNEKKNYNGKLKSQFTSLKNKITYFEKYFIHLPLNKRDFDLFSQARMKYHEAEELFKRGQILETKIRTDEAEKLINRASDSARELLKNFYADYPKWVEDASYARKLSRNGQTVILINKLESTCLVLKSNKTIGSFSAEFGRNWFGDKKRMGDKATPEGIYHIVEKKSGNKTKFYKSLLINYPNSEDKKRFDKLVKSGAISKNSKIGGLIEIHGLGGKGSNWTDGCIALENTEMDKLFGMVGVNTPVIIIGSEIPYDKFFN